MFTKREIFNDIKFNTFFKVTADYEWALNCYQKKTKFDFINTAIVNFKEGGFSEVHKIQSRIEELFIQSMHFRDNKSLLEGNAFTKLKLYCKGNNSLLPKLLSEINKQFENLNISDVEINLFGYGSLLKYTNILSKINYKRIYDRNFDAINKSYDCKLVEDPCQIKINSNEHFLITALGYESEIEHFLKSKMINPKQIFKFEI